MLEKRRWDIFHSFELRQKKLFLKNLTIRESQKVFKNLYQFAHKMNKDSCRKLNVEHIQALMKVHSILMKVK